MWGVVPVDVCGYYIVLGCSCCGAEGVILVVCGMLLFLWVLLCVRVSVLL